MAIFIIKKYDAEFLHFIYKINDTKKCKKNTQTVKNTIKYCL